MHFVFFDKLSSFVNLEKGTRTLLSHQLFTAFYNQVKQGSKPKREYLLILSLKVIEVKQN